MCLRPHCPQGAGRGRLSVEVRTGPGNAQEGGGGAQGEQRVAKQPSRSDSWSSCEPLHWLMQFSLPPSPRLRRENKVNVHVSRLCKR